MEVKVLDGYEGKTYGIYIYKVIKLSDQDGKEVKIDSYMITILPLKAYLAKKEKYKANPKITIREY